MPLRSALILMFWALMVGACAYMIPYFSNDYRYMQIQGSEELIASLNDIVISQWTHYFNWGGRTVAHTIAQTLLYLGKPWSAFFNALCYVILVLVIYAHAFGELPRLKTLRPMGLLIITFMLWLCLRIYGEVIFMLVSSCNYLYTSTLVMLFLLPYRLSFASSSRRHGILFGIVMLIMGVIAGWTNENTGLAECLGVGICGLWLMKQQRLRAWHVLGGIGLAIGYLLLMLSPGNAARLEFMEEGGYTFWGHLPKAIGIYFVTLATQLPIIASIVYMGWRLKKNRMPARAPSLWYGAWWNFLIGITALTVMIGSPNFPSRACAPFTFFSIAALTGLYALACSQTVELVSPRVKKILLTLCVIYIVPTVANTLYIYHQAMEDGHQRDLEIASKIASGQQDLVVKPFHVRTSKYVYIGDVRAQHSYFANGILRKFYKVRSIRRQCNYVMPVIAYDVMYLQFIEPEGVCTGDRGDPYDPKDVLNQKYLKDHPQEIALLKFPKDQSYTYEDFARDMHVQGLENAIDYLKK